MEVNSDSEEGIIVYGEIINEDVYPGEPVRLEEEPAGVGSQIESGEVEDFDITLAATHSYMGEELQDVSGRNVLEAGWRGTVPAMVHRSCVFPGETVPLLLIDQENADILMETIKKDRLFALLCPDWSGQKLSGYGVLCEVFEAAAAAGSDTGARFKARAVHRCRHTRRAQLYSRLQSFEVVVLPEITMADPLRAARLACLDPHRRGNTVADGSVRRLDAAATPWPRFVYDMFHVSRMRQHIARYFTQMGLGRCLPEEPVSLSFWVARNLTLSARDRLALFTVDNVLLRLHLECTLIAQKSVVCCGSCMTELARRDHVLPMSSDGVHSTYTNSGGYMHDIVTVSTALNTVLSGAPSSEYSWFPGYSWTVALCARCMAHVGWRFDALKCNLRPARFYGLCRNYVTPQGAGADDPDAGADDQGAGADAPDAGDAPRDGWLPVDVL